MKKINLMYIIKKHKLDKIFYLVILTIFMLPYQNCTNTHDQLGKLVQSSSLTSPSSGTPNNPEGPKNFPPADPPPECNIASSTNPTDPSLPQSCVNTSYNEPTFSVTVNNGTELQNALNQAASTNTATTIILQVNQANPVFKGTITLPARTATNNWIYIKSSNLNNLPPEGYRVKPSDAVNMPKIEIDTVLTSDFGRTTMDSGVNGTYNSAIVTEAGTPTKKALNYRFIGIEIRPAKDNIVYNLVTIGNSDAATSTMPTNIIFDRCYIHGNANRESTRGILMDGVSIAVINSHVSDFNRFGNDSQALVAINAAGPLKIVNNYLEATGENFMSGGGDPRVYGQVPSDIEIRYNHFYKQLSWRDVVPTMVVKNLIEFKNAQRVLVEGNIFENHWAASQAGFALLITPRNQGGTAPWSVTKDLTFRNNYFKNIGGGFNIAKFDDNPTRSQWTENVLIENNIFTLNRFNTLIYYQLNPNTNQQEPVYYLSTGKFFQLLSGPRNVKFLNNTGIHVTNSGAISSSEESPYLAEGLVISKNIFSHADYGFFGQSSCCGTVSLNKFYTGWTVTENVIFGLQAAGASPSQYPTNNYYPVDANSVGFTDFNNFNYQLLPTSPYYKKDSNQKDIGVDYVKLNQALSYIKY